MRFFVINHLYNPLSDEAFEEAQDAADEAFDLVYNLRAASTAIVVGMESLKYRTDIPSHLLVKVTALSDLERF